MTEKEVKTQPKPRVQKNVEPTFSKEAVVNHFDYIDRPIANVLLDENTRYTVKQATDIVTKWKKGEVK